MLVKFYLTMDNLPNSVEEHYVKVKVLGQGAYGKAILYRKKDVSENFN